LSEQEGTFFLEKRFLGFGEVSEPETPLGGRRRVQQITPVFVLQNNLLVFVAGAELDFIQEERLKK